MRIKETIIVEGEHDKHKILTYFDADVIVCGGFQIFKDKEMQKLIKKISEKNGAVILTDSDRAGFIIRNFIKNVAPNVMHAYIPEIKGKEKRKPKPGKEGLLGVEGMEKEVLKDALLKSGVTIDGEKIEAKRKYTKTDLYIFGLAGQKDSAVKRRKFLIKNWLPQKMSANMILEVINTLDIELFWIYLTILYVYWGDFFMKRIIVTKQKEGFSFIKYILFTYFKKNSLYEENLKNDILFIPYKKRLKTAYLKAICVFLKSKGIKEILTFDRDIKEVFKYNFSVIDGKNIYCAIFNNILDFMASGRLYEYEVVFLSDNIKEIRYFSEKCVKKVKNISILTEKPYLYESLKDLMMQKYGVTLNIRTKKEKLKKKNKIYVNSGPNRVFDKSAFNNVNILDIYNVYECVYNEIILYPDKKAKEYTKLLKCPYNLALAEFLYGEKIPDNLKIVNIKK